MHERYVLGLEEIDETHVAIAGGKAAHLGELSRIDGIRVPAGFCVTTHAFRRIMAEAAIDDQLERMSRVELDDLAALGAEIRRTIEAIAMPDEIAAAIARELGEHTYAVRSSATAEDLPAASFAGQHDTYLNVAPAAIVPHVIRCWASLFSERAVTYRRRNGFDDRKVQMAVVVQQMVFPHAAGILFTADPVTGHRNIASVEASFGLGEALVSGLVNADVYKVRGDEVVARTIGTKKLAVLASPGGGTHTQAIELARQRTPALGDPQVVQLARLGRRIEAHFDRPQDIEWCFADDDFQIVQSRPITTLFPIPERADRETHVYISVGHAQMMTDPMKPLGLSLFLMTTPAPMHVAGGRLFVDVTKRLASPASRRALLEMAAKSDPLLEDALRTVIGRDLIPLVHDEAPSGPAAAPPASEIDPAIVGELMGRTQASLAALQRDIQTKAGSELLDFIVADVQELKRILFDPESHRVFMTAMEAAWWLNEHLSAWLGDNHASDVLTQSVPDNVTSEMGLALLDVADAIRPHPEVVAFLQRVHDDGFLAELLALAGGREARDAIAAWLDRYGMRGVGEIDVTRPRWSERPAMLVPLILGNVKNFEPGAAAHRFERGRREAADKEREILARLRALADGEHKAAEAKRRIDRLRRFIGYREYPKYGMVSRYFVYKQALLAEADRLVRAHVLADREDIFFLTFSELHDVVRTRHADAELVRRRRDAFSSYRALTPPRVLTSDGECIAGSYRRDDLPAGTLVGLPVSAGTVEGRARVILDVARADLEPGDILVTAYTDPSWTPLFVAIKGLVTEAGGLMTHGAVIAREYGLPAVVGVEHATRLIRDGQRIRVHGTDGLVEILPAAS